MSLAENIVKAREDAGISQSELARRINVTPQSVQLWEVGKTAPKRKRMQQIAAALGVSVNQLEFGAPDQQAAVQRDFAKEDALNHQSVGAEVEIRGFVPLISSVPAGDFMEAIDNFQPGDAEDWLPCPVPHSKFTYCVQVDGDSMVDVYPEGYIVFVDPMVNPKHRDDVIVRQLPEGKVTLKRYMEDGENRYLKAMNRAWPNPIIPIDGDAEFCGVVIFAGYYPQRNGG